MPADRSSPIPPALSQLTRAAPLRLQEAETPHLLAYLATVPDPRTARGRRHPLVAILATAAAAVLAGARSVTAIAEWAADAPQPVRAALGARRDAPDHFTVPAEATIRRTLARLDAEALAVAIGAWLAGQDPDRDCAGTGRRRAVAVDGKTLRGARAPAGDGRSVHLGAAMDHATRAVPAQQQVGGAPEEVPAFAPLLERLELGGVVVTADALQTQPAAAELLVTHKQAHDLLVVKANQPTLGDRCAGLPWHRIPELDRTQDRGHGRVEVRTLKAVTVGHFGFPHAAQVLQVTRRPASCTTPDGADRPGLCGHQPHLRPGPAPPGSPTTCAGTGPSRRCTPSATSPSPRTAPSFALALAPASWLACAISPSVCSAARGRSTSPPRCATTPATPPGPGHPRHHPGSNHT